MSILSTCIDVQIYRIFLFKENFLASHFYTGIKLLFFLKQLEFLLCSKVSYYAFSHLFAIYVLDMGKRKEDKNH